MEDLTLSSADRIEAIQTVTRGWVEELGAFVIDETARLVLHSSAEPELGWRIDRAAEAMSLPATLDQPEAIAA